MNEFQIERITFVRQTFRNRFLLLLFIRSVSYIQTSQVSSSQELISRAWV